MFALGVTNGYWATLCMMFGPVMVEPQDGERAGSVMLLCLVVGLGTFNVITPPPRYIVELYVILCLARLFSLWSH